MLALLLNAWNTKANVIVDIIDCFIDELYWLEQWLQVIAMLALLSNAWNTEANVIIVAFVDVRFVCT